MSSCPYCYEDTLVLDPSSSATVCTSCGRIISVDQFRSQPTFTPSGLPQPTTLHSLNNDFTYHDRKLHNATALISSLTSRFNLSSSRASQVHSLVSQLTDNSFGSGHWFSVLTSAATYIVSRQNRLPFSIQEVCDLTSCDEPQITQMVTRILKHLDLGQLPEFDVISALERAVKNGTTFSNLTKTKVEEVIGQGRFLMNCSRKWFLTTGRRPMPVVAAVLAFVAEVNGIGGAGVEEIAKEVYAAVGTSRLRLKELKETLVRVARVVLPWGEDVSVKNLVHNAPVLIRFMELKAKSCKEDDAFEFDVGGVLSSVESYACDDEEDSEYINNSGGGGMGCGDVGTFKISGERLSNAYKNVMERIASIRELGGSDRGKGKKRAVGVEIDALKGSWPGRWNFDKKLTFEEVLERDVGYDNLPPSFVNGVESLKRRREKIEAAKIRIDETMKPLSGSLPRPEAKEGRDSKSSKGRKRRRRGVGDVDWEDCIIELLLLHRIDEEEIEKGHYNRLLDLHVFNSSSTQR